MAYSTVPRVQAYLNKLGGPGITISTTSQPSEAEVLEWIDEVSADIDAAFREAGYEVPLTGTSDVVFVRRYVSMKVASLTWEAGFMSDELPGKIKAWRNEYDKFIERVLGGKIGLINQTGNSRVGTVFVSSHLEDEDV